MHASEWDSSKAPPCGTLANDIYPERMRKHSYSVYQPPFVLRSVIDFESFPLFEGNDIIFQHLGCGYCCEQFAAGYINSERITVDRRLEEVCDSKLQNVVN